MRIADKRNAAWGVMGRTAWQDSSDTVGEFNGTVPTATVPAYPSTRAVSFWILQRRIGSVYR